MEGQEETFERSYFLNISYTMRFFEEKSAGVVHLLYFFYDLRAKEKTGGGDNGALLAKRRSR